MTAYVEECRQEWKRLGVPDLMAEEMATELETDLAEAEADGVSAAEMLGESDPRRFAATWASERGLVAEPAAKKETALALDRCRPHPRPGLRRRPRALRGRRGFRTYPRLGPPSGNPALGRAPELRRTECLPGRSQSAAGGLYRPRAPPRL